MGEYNIKGYCSYCGEYQYIVDMYGERDEVGFCCECGSIVGEE